MTKNEYNQKYRREHKEEIKQYKQKYRIEHKKDINIYQLNYYYKNQEKVKTWKRRCYFNNHKKRILHSIEYNNKNRILCNLRIRIWKALKGINKSESTMKLVGCSIDFLKKHLENKFSKGMTWSNYGKWHIDHIRPCAKFDLNKASEQKKCFHYTNLQPLWAKENLSKHDKYIGE